MIDFPADFPTFFSDFAEDCFFDDLEIVAVLEPLADTLAGSEALSDVDLIAYVKKSDVALISKRIKTGNCINLNTRRYCIRSIKENYGVLELMLAKKDGF